MNSWGILEAVLLRAASGVFALLSALETETRQQGAPFLACHVRFLGIRSWLWHGLRCALFADHVSGWVRGLGTRAAHLDLPHNETLVLNGGCDRAENLQNRFRDIAPLWPSCGAAMDLQCDSWFGMVFV